MVGEEEEDSGGGIMSERRNVERRKWRRKAMKGRNGKESDGEEKMKEGR